MRAAFIVLLATLLIACDDPAAAPRTGQIVVVVSTSGGDFDPDGVTVLIDGESVGTVDLRGTVSKEVDAGGHSVGLGDVATTCSAPVPVSISVQGGREAWVHLELICIG